LHLGLAGPGQAAWNPDVPARTDTENALVINEIMPNPSGSDGGKEWFELYNRWFTPLHLKDWTILGEGSNESHVVETDLEISMDAYSLLGQTPDSSTNGGYIPDYVYGTTVSLSNFGESLAILDGSGISMDSVSFDDSFPFGSGVSMELIRPDYNNNDSTSWLVAGLPYGAAGNMGTPGQRNAAFSGTIALNNTPINYGYVTEGAEAQLSVTVYNHGVADLSLNSISNDTEFFSLTPNAAVIVPDDSLIISISFAPQMVQVYTDTITILSNDPYSPINTIALTGSAINEFADIVVMAGENDSLSTLQFPFTRLGESRIVNVIVTNIGTPNLEIEEIILDGDSEFSTDADAAILSFLDTMNIAITYTPTAAGTNSGILTFGSNDPDEATYVVNLFGQAAENIILFVPSEYPTISIAVDSAYSQDTVEVAPGIYEEMIDFGNKNIVFRGSGSPEETIIQGDGTGPVFSITGGQDNTTILSYITIKNGGGSNGGGMLINNGSSPQLKKILLTNNSASNGAGIYCGGFSNPTLDHLTLVLNNATGNEGAIIAVAGGSSVNINNSIFWANTGISINVLSGEETTTYSIVEGGNAGTGISELDPQFMDPVNANFSLQWISPAIDSGDPTSETDLDGTVSDMGALAYNQTLQPPDPVGDFSGSPSNGEVALSWSFPLDPRGNPNGDITNFILYRGDEQASALDTLAILDDNALSYLDQGDETHLINGMEYTYVIISVDTASFTSSNNDTLIVIPAGGTLALIDSVNNFGSVDHAQQTTWEFIVFNEGNGILSLDSLYTSSSWYSVGQSSATILPGESDTTIVTFNPDITTGSLMDTLIVTSDDLENPERRVALSGSSLWPVVELTATELDFGNVRVEQSEILSITLSNTGTDTLFVDSIYVLNENSGFVPALADGGTSRSVIDRLKSKGFEGFSSMRISALMDKGSKESKSSDQGDVTKQGSGSEKQHNNKDSFTRDTKSHNKPLPLENNSTSGKLSAFGILSKTDLSRLVLSTEIYPGEFLNVDVLFSRPDTITITDEMRITSDDPLGNDELSVTLTAHSVAPVLTVSADTLNFGNIFSATDLAIQIGNDGTDTLNISAIDFPSGFTGSLTDSTIMPSETAQINVSITPVDNGYWSGEIMLTSDSYQQSQHSVQTSAISLNTFINHDFDGVLIGQTNDTTFILNNMGSTDLIIDSLGIGETMFTTDLITNTTVAADGNISIAVTFAPTERDSISGNVLLYTPVHELPIDIGAVTGRGWVLPGAEFAAKSISVVAAQGQDGSFNVSLTNNGDYPLDYSTNITADYAGWIWLSTVESGQVTGISTSDIEVQVLQTANLDPGTYNGSIYFSTNTGSDPTILLSNTDTVSVFLNLLGDDSDLTDTTITIPSGNTPPIIVTDDNGTPIGLMLDFVNSAGGTVSVQSIATLPPVDQSTSVSDPDGLITDPVYPEKYYEINANIEGDFVTDIGLDYGSLSGISDPQTLRLAKRPGNAGPAEPWVIISVANTDIDTTEKLVVANNQTSFSQWAMISNSSDNSFTDTQGPAWSALTTNPAQPGVLVDVAVNVNMSDNSGIDNVTLFYTQGGSSQYTSTTMSASNDAYSGTIPGSAVTQNGIIYYVTAQDLLGYITTTDTIGVSVNFASGTLTTNSATSSAYPTGLPIDTWRLISTPAVLTETSTSQVLDELGTQDDATWRLFRYDPVSETYKSNPLEINTTEAYWIYQKVEDNLALATTAGETGNMSKTDLTLATGWNFIGSPYPFPISLSLDQVQFYGPLTFGLSGESWSPVVTELDPWNGYVVYNRTSSDQTITLNPISSGQALAARVTNNENGWLIQMSAASGIYKDSYNLIGQLESASNDLDWHDNPEFLSPGNYLSVAFNVLHENSTIALTSDLRELSENVQIWDGEISASGLTEPVELSWHVEKVLTGDIAVNLIDLNTRRVLDLTAPDQYLLGDIDDRYSRQIKILAGDPGQVALAVDEILATIPEELSLDGNYPNPFNPVTTIRFGLPEPRNIRITVVNILGQEITELVNGWRDMGRHEVIWQGVDGSGKAVASGMYFTVLSDGNKIIVQKMLLLK